MRRVTPIFIFCLLSFGLTLTAHAVDATQAINTAETNNFVPLVGIPFVHIQPGQSLTFGDYINAFYYGAISVAAFLAVLRIIFAGVQYMTTEAVNTKGNAKKDIRAAIIGLLLVVGAVLILYTINPQLTKLALFKDAPIPGMSLSQTQAPAMYQTTDANNSSKVVAACQGKGTIVRKSTGHNITTVCCFSDGSSTDPLCAAQNQKLTDQKKYNDVTNSYTSTTDRQTAIGQCTSQGGQAINLTTQRIGGLSQATIKYYFTCRTLK